MRLPTFWAICEAWDWDGLEPKEPLAMIKPEISQAVAQGDDRAAEFADLSLEDRFDDFDGHFEQIVDGQFIRHSLTDREHVSTYPC